ncbi:MAG: hypothetical protein IPK26_11375 [Planctomycetes bacterium]|nr:hypothetical protein [Planctomycetota bacterium]
MLRNRPARVLFAAAIAAVSASSQTPVIHEATWRLVARVPVLAPGGAHFHPDGSIWVGSRLTAGSGGAIVRIDATWTASPIVSCDRPASVVVDPVSGDVFYSEDYGGNIHRVPAGSAVSQVWVSGFHSGDDDPWGMAIAPSDYSGSVLGPGQALVCDHGTNGPKEIWQWTPSVAQNERLVVPNNGALANPMDVAISTGSVWVVDGLPPPGRVFEVLPGGALRLLNSSPSLPLVGAIAIDPQNQHLLLRGHNTVHRLDPLTGANTLVLDVPGNQGGAGDGIDVSADGRRMALAFTNRHEVLIFERTARHEVVGAGCAGTVGAPALRAANGPPRLGTTFHVDIAPVPAAGLAFGILGLQPASVVLDPFGMIGCRLLVSNQATELVTVRPSPGTLNWAIAIPNEPALEAVQVLQQVVVADAGANPAGAIVSDAARLVLSSF